MDCLQKVEKHGLIHVPLLFVTLHSGTMQQRSACTPPCLRTGPAAHFAELASTLQLKNAHLSSHAWNLTQLLTSLSWMAM